MTETRFEFGENWTSFLDHLDDDRIEQAQHSLSSLLRLDPDAEQPLAGKTFLDLGSGSGLFSLAAFRLGGLVTSIDFDPQCVACTKELRRRESADEESWKVSQGSALDETMLRSLGHFDVVYSWGVLHHTGEMERAMELAGGCVDDAGLFAIAIYNDQGGASRRWLKIKQTYHRLPSWLRPPWVALIAAWYELKFGIARLAQGKNPLPFADWKRKKQDRGMSAWHDWVDWVGGLPFEVAKPEAVIMPRLAEGFRLSNLTTVGNGWGCNEFVFERSRPPRGRQGDEPLR